MRKLGLHILAVGADQGRGVEDGIVNADLVSLPQQRFRQFDVGALTEVVAARLEAQSEEGDPTAFARDDSIDRFVDRQSVACQRSGEQRNINAFGTAPSKGASGGLSEGRIRRMQNPAASTWGRYSGRCPRRRVPSPPECRR